MELPIVTAQSLCDRLKATPDCVIVDVRSAAELVEGVIPSAVHLPLDVLAHRASEVLLDPDALTIVYCAEGVRSTHALRLLHQLGYTRVAQLECGFAQWKALGFPVVNPPAGLPTPCGELGPARYSRQLQLAQVGLAGQERLASARALLIGLGGLGAPAALYLAGAGVGTLGLVDPDRVALSNLHRQIIHTTSRIGTNKVESATVQLRDLNPDVILESYPERFSAANAERIMARDWEVILDGSDNFELRYTLNAIAVKQRVPVCHGSIDRYEGRATTFLAERGPCYRCLFPHPPEPGTIGSCSENGVLGVLPGVIGTLQATEALKLILGIGKPLSGRMLIYDALALEFREMRYSRDPDCPVCAAKLENT